MGRDERIGSRRRTAAFSAVPAASGSVQPGSGVRAERELDAESARMEGWLAELRRAPGCRAMSTGPDAPPASCRCGAGIRTGCETDLQRLGGQILDFMSEHFARENTLMRRGSGIRGLRELFELHAEDHGSMLSSLVSAFALPSPCAQKSAIAALLDQHMRRHLLTHDAVLREHLPRLCHEPVPIRAAR